MTLTTNEEMESRTSKSKVPHRKMDRKKERKNHIDSPQKKSQCIRLNTRGCDISAMLMKISSAG